MKNLYHYKLISKAGRTSYNRYKILTERDEILESPLRKKKSQPLFPSTEKIYVYDLLKQAINTELKKKSVSDQRNNEKTPEILKRHLRNPSESQLSSQVSLKPSYFFSPSYKAQDPHIPTIKFKYPVSTARNKKELKRREHVHSLCTPRPSIINHVPSGIAFKKQLSRSKPISRKRLTPNRLFLSPLLFSSKTSPRVFS